MRVEATLLPPGSFPEPDPSQPFRVPFKLVFRIDLYRGSDGVLMASSRVRKSASIPASAKSVLAEAERLLRGLA